MKRWQLREVGADDLPRISPWLPAGASRVLPAGAGPAARPGRPTFERWLLAEWSETPGGPATPGACWRLRGGIGLDRPRHWFHLGCAVHAAPELGLFHHQATLLLGNDLTGACELADAACDEAGLTLAEQAQAWQQLLRAALLGLAARQPASGTALIIELPGLRDAEGCSPFWRGLGQRFHAPDPVAVQRQHGPDWRGPLAALLPRQPVYTAFLDEPARAAIAQTAPAARVLMQTLLEAGLRFGHHVCIDDAGPVLEAPLAALPGLREARRAEVRRGAAASTAAAAATDWLVWHAEAGLLGCHAGVLDRAGHWAPGAAAAATLQDGDPVWLLPAR